MSERTAQFAFDTLLAVDLADEALAMEMYAIYEVVDGYESWCRVVGLNPDSDDAEHLYYEVVHVNYIKTWNEMGQDAWAKAINPLVTKWREILGTRGR